MRGDFPKDAREFFRFAPVHKISPEEIARHCRIPLAKIHEAVRDEFSTAVGAAGLVPELQRAIFALHDRDPDRVPRVSISLGDRTLAALQVKGAYMEPVYEDGDLLFFYQGAVGVHPSAEGQRCLIKALDSEEMRLGIPRWRPG